MQNSKLHMHACILTHDLCQPGLEQAHSWRNTREIPEGGRSGSRKIHARENVAICSGPSSEGMVCVYMFVCASVHMWNYVQEKVLQSSRDATLKV